MGRVEKNRQAEIKQKRYFAIQRKLSINKAITIQQSQLVSIWKY